MIFAVTNHPLIISLERRKDLKEPCKRLETSVSEEIQREVINNRSISAIILDIKQFANVYIAIDLAEQILKIAPTQVVIYVSGLNKNHLYIEEFLSLGINRENILFDDTQLQAWINTYVVENITPGATAETAKPIIETAADISGPPLASKSAADALTSITSDAKADKKETKKAAAIATEADVEKADFAIPKKLRKAPDIPQKISFSAAVAGAGHRIGTTTQAMQMVLFMREQGYTAALIEMTAAGDSSLTSYLQELEENKEFSLIDEEHYRIYGIDCYRSGRHVAKAKLIFECLVFDYGCYSELADGTSFWEKDFKIIVAGVKPWEQAALQPVFDNDDGSVNYLFNFTLETDRKDIRSMMLESAEKTYFADWSPDYFKYCGQDALYKGIFKMDKKAPSKNKSKGFFSFLKKHKEGKK